jgi:hypothetical protein
MQGLGRQGGKEMNHIIWARFNIAIIKRRRGEISREVFIKLWEDAQKKGGTCRPKNTIREEAE